MLEVSLIIFGLGSVGRTLARQILASRDFLARRRGLRLRLVAFADSSGYRLAPAGLLDEEIKHILAAKETGVPLAHQPGGQPGPALALLEVMDARADSPPILVDVTASAEMGDVLRAALTRGWGVVTANKIPLTAPWETARLFFESDHLGYEATVGAGLPVIATLRTLLDGGDLPQRIKGLLSGTLGYICHRLQQGIPFSTALREAWERGYTEPDPRQDLGGLDVARKLLILARTAGWPLELADIAVQPLYPPEPADASVEEFMAAIIQSDGAFAARVREARTKGQVLRYIGAVSAGGGKVGLQAVPEDSPWGTLRGADNLVAFHTAHYRDTPLVIIGPGAGPEVTAAGVLGDVVRIAKREGHATRKARSIEHEARQDSIN